MQVFWTYLTQYHLSKVGKKFGMDLFDNIILFTKKFDIELFADLTE